MIQSVNPAPTGRNRRTTNAQTYLGGNLRRIRSLYVSIGR